MKKDKELNRIDRLRAIIVELSVAAEDMVEYNNVENDELYMLPTIVFSVRDIVREELRKAEAEEGEE